MRGAYGHFRRVCVHGKQTSQCRCASPYKVVYLDQCAGTHNDLPVMYSGEIGGLAVPVHSPDQTDEEADREALVELIKRISPIKSEPLATAVAEEWAEEFIKEGWHR